MLIRWNFPCVCVFMGRRGGHEGFCVWGNRSVFYVGFTGWGLSK